jgi:hypothetical protein
MGSHAVWGEKAPGKTMRNGVDGDGDLGLVRWVKRQCVVIEIRPVVCGDEEGEDAIGWLRDKFGLGVFAEEN